MPEQSSGGHGVSLKLALAYAVGVGMVSAGTQSVLAIASSQVCEDAENRSHPSHNSSMSPNSSLISTLTLQKRKVTSAECAQLGNQVVSAYICCYSLFGVFGAIVADTRLGHAKTQMLSSIVWLIGIASLSYVLSEQYSESHFKLKSDSTFVFFAVGSLVVTSAAFGAGWSTLSVFVGHQMPNQTKNEHTSGGMESNNGNGSSTNMFWFSMLYIALNIGDLLAEAGCPMIRQYFSVSAVTWTLTGCLAVSVSLFLLGYSGFSRPLDQRHVRTSVSNLQKNLDASQSTAGKEECLSEHYAALDEIDTLAARSDESILESTSISRVMWRTGRIFIALPIYFGLFFQQSDTWTFQSRALDRDVGPGWFVIPADAMPALNDILVIVILPLLTQICIPRARQKFGSRVCLPIQRLSLGIASAALAFVCAGSLQYTMSHTSTQLPIWYQVPQYIFVSIAEAFVGSTGLEFAYNEALPKYRAVVTSLWFLAAALGQAIMLILPVIFPFLKSKTEVPFGFYYACAIAMSIVLICFLVLTRSYKYQHHNYH